MFGKSIAAAAVATAGILALGAGMANATTVSGLPTGGSQDTHGFITAVSASDIWVSPQMLCSPGRVCAYFIGAPDVVPLTAHTSVVYHGHAVAKTALARGEYVTVATHLEHGSFPVMSCLPQPPPRIHTMGSGISAPCQIATPTFVETVITIVQP
jgi:hypothetical protein